MSNNDKQFNNGEIVLSFKDIGDINIRKHIDGFTQEAFVDFVANYVFEDGYYRPLRKDPLMVVMFIESFVVDGNKLLEMDENGTVDLYATYDLWEVSRGLVTAARGSSSDINHILTRIENAVDLMVFHKQKQWNSILASGMATISGETLSSLNEMVKSITDVANNFSQYLDKNRDSLEDGLKEVAALNQLLRSVEKKKHSSKTAKN